MNVIPFRQRPSPYIAAYRAGLPRSECKKIAQQCRYERRADKPEPPRAA